MTLARSTEEEVLLLESLKELSRSGLPIYAADGGSRPEFVARAGEVAGVTIVSASGRLVGQIQTALWLASEAAADNILYTEPDKRVFFANGLPEFLQRAAKNAGASVVVPCRDEESFRTFPAGQQRTERSFNELASFFLGTEADLLYGPLLFDRRRALPFIHDVAGDLGWGWRPYVIARCVRAGYSVACEPGSFPCPPEQRREDDPTTRVYRLEQLAQNVEGLRRGLLHSDAASNRAPG